MQAKDQARELAKLLNDPVRPVRSYAVSALSAMGLLPPELVPKLSEAYYDDHSRQGQIRFLCYCLTGGDAEAQMMISRIMLLGPNQEPRRLPSIEKARETLLAFNDLMPSKRINSGFADDADKQILRIAEDLKGKWSPSADHELSFSLSQEMDRDSAIALAAKIEIPWRQTAFENLWRFVAAQVAFWILLLYFYPKSTRVQAFFIWNQWARKFFGLGYVDFFLTWVSFLRNRLLAPFPEELTSDARIGPDGLEGYFEDVEVQELEKPAALVRVSQAIPEIRGQIVLEGESGLGKTIFLQRLVNNAKSPIAYLPADSYDNGPLAAIQVKLKGKAGDESFLRSIIYSGGLRIVIDGLNEVTVETREKILRFLDEFPKAHVLLATQPLLWKRPPKARVLRLRRSATIVFSVFSKAATQLSASRCR